MTITVDITPEVRAELARQAAAQGRAVEAYAASLLEDAVHVSTGETEAAPAKKSLQEVFEMVRGLADDVDFSRNPSTGRPIDLS
jgi:hypothetical protein